MLEAYEGTETQVAGDGLLGGDAGEAAAWAGEAVVLRRALRVGVAAVWIFPWIQLRVAEGVVQLSFSTLAAGLLAGGVLGPGLLHAQRLRLECGRRAEQAGNTGDAGRVGHVGYPGYTALAARSAAAALGAGALATLVYRLGDTISWSALCAVCVLWLAALLLDRGRRAGFLLAQAACAALCALIPATNLSGVGPNGTDPDAIGALAVAAAVALALGRWRDDRLVHRERLRAAKVRELAPGQEPDGPQDAVPPEVLRAEQERQRERAEAALLAEGKHRSGAVGAIVLVADLVAVLIGFRVMQAICAPGASDPDTWPTSSERMLLLVLLGAGLIVVYVVLTVIAGHARRFGLATVQICLMGCTLAMALALSGGIHHVNQGPVELPTGVSTTSGDGGAGYCSGGTCYGNARNEG